MTTARELCTHEGAQQLAKQLDEWWHRRGHSQVTHWIEAILAPRSVKDAGQERLYVVRSNLINGLPPRANNDNRIVETRRASSDE